MTSLAPGTSSTQGASGERGERGERSISMINDRLRCLSGDAEAEAEAVAFCGWVSGRFGGLGRSGAGGGAEAVAGAVAFCE